MNGPATEDEAIAQMRDLGWFVLGRTEDGGLLFSRTPPYPATDPRDREES